MSSVLYDAAKEILSKASPRHVKCLDSDNLPFNEDASEIWAKMTKEERGWYVLFEMVEYWCSWPSLELISPSPEVTIKFHKIINDKRNARNRDILVISLWSNWVEMLKRERDAERIRAPKYTANDIAVELKFRINSDKPTPEIIMAQAAFEKPSIEENERIVRGIPRFPKYTKGSSPVRHITPEEYLNTNFNKRGPNHAE